MKKVILISCVKSKQTKKAKAKDLYISPLFKKSYLYATNIKGEKDEIYILSAKYGLINEDAFIYPYDLTLNNFKELDKKKWAYKVYIQLSSILKPNDKVIFLGGENYIKYLRVVLKNKIEEPLKGLSLGYSLKKLNNLNSKYDNSRKIS